MFVSNYACSLFLPEVTCLLFFAIDCRYQRDLWTIIQEKTDLNRGVQYFFLNMHTSLSFSLALNFLFKTHIFTVLLPIKLLTIQSCFQYYSLPFLLQLKKALPSLFLSHNFINYRPNVHMSLITSTNFIN